MTTSTANTVPASPPWTARAGLEHLAGHVERLGQALVPLGPAEDAGQPLGEDRLARERLRERHPALDVAGHRHAGAVDRRVADPLARQPERLGERDLALQEQGEQVAELGQRRVPPDRARRPAGRSTSARRVAAPSTK